MRLWVRGSAWLALSLLLWTVGVESTHQHLNKTESATCSICVVAHSTRPMAGVSHSTPVFAPIGLLQEEDVVAKAQFDFSDAGIRGPPAL